MQFLLFLDSAVILLTCLYEIASLDVCLSISGRQVERAYCSEDNGEGMRLQVRLQQVPHSIAFLSKYCMLDL